MEQYNLETIVPGAQNDTLNTGTENFPYGSDGFIDFTAVDPFSEGVV